MSQLPHQFVESQTHRIIVGRSISAKMMKQEIKPNELSQTSLYSPEQKQYYFDQQRDDSKSPSKRVNLQNSFGKRIRIITRRLNEQRSLEKKQESQYKDLNDICKVNKLICVKNNIALQEQAKGIYKLNRVKTIQNEKEQDKDEVQCKLYQKTLEDDKLSKLQQLIQECSNPLFQETVNKISEQKIYKDSHIFKMDSQNDQKDMNNSQCYKISQLKNQNQKALSSRQFPERNFGLIIKGKTIQDKAITNETQQDQQKSPQRKITNNVLENTNLKQDESIINFYQDVISKVKSIKKNDESPMNTKEEISSSNQNTEDLFNFSQIETRHTNLSQSAINEQMSESLTLHKQFSQNNSFNYSQIKLKLIQNIKPKNMEISDLKQSIRQTQQKIESNLKQIDNEIKKEKNQIAEMKVIKDQCASSQTLQSTRNIRSQSFNNQNNDQNNKNTTYTIKKSILTRDQVSKIFKINEQIKMHKEIEIKNRMTYNNFIQNNQQNKILLKNQNYIQLYS